MVDTRQIPNPQNYRSMEEWAQQLYYFLSANTTRFGQTNNPLPVLLPHIKDNVTARATEDGILLFDPTEGRAVVSINGTFENLLISDDLP